MSESNEDQIVTTTVPTKTFAELLLEVVSKHKVAAMSADLEKVVEEEFEKQE